MENIDEGIKKYGPDLKILLAGNVSTGKTSIINRYIKNIFKETWKATIVAEFSHKIIEKNDKICRLVFWDIPGQDRTPNLIGIFCRDVNGIIFSCQVNDEKSKNDLLKWKKSLESFIDIKEIPIIIMDNKCDLLNEDEEKLQKENENIKNFAEKNNFTGSFITSAKTGHNIENAISFLVDEIFKNIKEEEYIYNNSILSNDSSKLNYSPKNKEDKTSKCC